MTDGHDPSYQEIGELLLQIPPQGHLFRLSRPLRRGSREAALRVTARVDRAICKESAQLPPLPSPTLRHSGMLQNLARCLRTRRTTAGLTIGPSIVPRRFYTTGENEDIIKMLHECTSLDFCPLVTLPFPCSDPWTCRFAGSGG